MDIRGKRVLVTGASSGLGAEIAKGLGSRGAIVAICGRRTTRLDEVLAEIQVASPASRAWTVDLGDLDRLEGFAAEVVAEFGGLDLLVNNAGIPKRRWAWDHRPDEVADVLRVNVESPIRLTLALLDALGASGGSVVFVGSVAARLAPPNEAVYAASKAAITAFAEGRHVDLAVARSGVGVHIIQPGVLGTELFSTPDNDASLADISPLDPSEIVAPLLAALDAGRLETFVPSWFADLPAVKTADLEGFLAGAVDYTRQRLVALGWPLPSPPGGVS